MCARAATCGGYTTVLEGRMREKHARDRGWETAKVLGFSEIRMGILYVSATTRERDPSVTGLGTGETCAERRSDRNEHKK